MRLDLVTRSGCHLCEVALDSLRRAGLEPRLLDVDSDPELFRLYDFRVPVVLRQGAPVLEGRIDDDAVARLVRLEGRLSG